MLLSSSATIHCSCAENGRESTKRIEEGGIFFSKCANHSNIMSPKSYYYKVEME